LISGPGAASDWTEIVRHTIAAAYDLLMQLHLSARIPVVFPVLACCEHSSLSH
jgi:hypothetical protein